MTPDPFGDAYNQSKTLPEDCCGRGRRDDHRWQLGVPVVMHPGGADNILKDGALRGRGDLGNIIGNPLETTYFLSRLIFDGTLDKFPGLRIVGAHAGGYLPSYLGRSEAACTVRANANCANKKKPSEYLKSQVLIDTMVFSDEGLRHLVAEVGVNQVVYGTDVPFNWPVTVDLVLDASFPERRGQDGDPEWESREAAED
jgi:aminocarboxymuconate-semialdehyde decarboxylase